ncbi:MAG TPA: hypothetical protein VFR41_01410 [Acidimicrobiia bacterium]|nr:hypothetical protein [Acidimicrobiia bacterium]
MTTWEAALDELEARLDIAERSGGREAMPPFEPPAVVGPLPAELTARAQALFDRGELLRTQLVTTAASLRSAVHHLPREAPSPGSHFEVSA